MLKDKLIEQVNATPDDAKAVVMVTLLADGTPQIYGAGVNTAGLIQMLSGAAHGLAGKLKIAPNAPA